MANYLVKAPAKINLFLNIIGQKEDNNYHLIQSFFVFVKLYDILEIKTNVLYSSTNFTNSKRNIHRYYNTVQKAIDLISKYAPNNEKIAIKITKNIKISAGLAGSSADAGAVLRKLGELWHIDNNTLLKIALEVGADVPSCLESKPVFVEGVGEKLHYPTSSSFLPKYILLVNPGKHLSTVKVYKNYVKNNFSPKLTKIPKTKDEWLELIFNSKNDLLNAALSFVPEIEVVLDLISKQKGCLISSMSGSGATCFGMFDTYDDVTCAFENIKHAYPNWWIKNTEVIN